LRLAGGVPTPVELFGDHLLKLLPAPRFVDMRVFFSPHSKTTPLGLTLLGMIGLGTFLGIMDLAVDTHPTRPVYHHRTRHRWYRSGASKPDARHCSQRHNRLSFSEGTGWLNPTFYKSRWQEELAGNPQNCSSLQFQTEPDGAFINKTGSCSLYCFLVSRFRKWKGKPERRSLSFRTLNADFALVLLNDFPADMQSKT